MKLPFRSAISLTLLVGMCLIALAVVASYLSVSSLFEGARLESQAQAAAGMAQATITDAKAAESLQRRYLLTGASSDFAAYEQARLQLRSAIDRVKALQPGAALTNGPALAALMSRQIELMDQAVQARQQTGLEAATALMANEANRQLHADIDGLVAQLAAGEASRREAAEQKSRRSSGTTKRLILLGGVLSLLLFGWTVLIMRRSQAQHRRIRSQLSDSEAMSRAVTESMAEGLVTATQDGLIVNANAAARQMFGHQLEAMVGREVNMLLPPRYRMGFDAFYGALGRRSPGFREWDVQVRGFRRDESEFPVNVSFGDVTAGGRRLFTAIIHDITESTRAASALRDSEAQMRQMTDAVPALIAYVDKDERIQFQNRSYEELFGQARTEVQGKTVAEVIGPELYAQVQPYIREVLEGKPVRYEREHAMPGGELREYVVNYFPRYGEGEEAKQVIGFFTLGTDVTELKRIDRMKSEFVSTVSHELRTPLTSIRGSLGLVWGGVTGELPEQARNLVGIAKSNCERLIRLINDILDSEKIESGKMRFELQALELEPLLELAIAANEGFSAQHNVQLQLRVPPHALRIHVDSDRLIQVITNLLSNAIKFSPSGGRVLVAASALKNRIRVEISDKGPGIPEEFRDRIFQKFSQADSSDTRLKGGTGLGLNISKAIMERMDGTMGFVTETGAGSTFFLELPEWREAPPVTAPASLYGLDRPRILVCEDDPDVARLISIILDKAGFDADIAHTAEQARDHLKMESYAAMTVDIQLPYENGLELIAEIRKQGSTAELPVVVVSVISEEARLHGNHHDLAISDWVEKPLDEQRLVRCVRRAVKRSRAEVGG